MKLVSQVDNSLYKSKNLLWTKKNKHTNYCLLYRVVFLIAERRAFKKPRNSKFNDLLRTVNQQAN